MGGKLGFKIFIGLLVAVPVITLFMVVGLERNYVEQLREDHIASLKHHPIHKRSPLEQRNEPDSMGFEAVSPERQDLSLGAGKQEHSKSSSRAQVFSKNNQMEHAKSEIAITGPQFYELLKERKIHELRVEKSMRESWWYLQNRLRSLKSVPSEDAQSHIEITLDSMRDQYNALKKWYGELNSVSPSDSPVQLNWQYWQQNVSTELQLLMEKRLDYLQNPKDCSSARKLVCNVGKTCGFGCQMHHVSYCFIVAYASERTLVIESKGWSYNSRGWEAVFKQVSPCSVSGMKYCAEICSSAAVLSLSGSASVDQTAC